MCYVLTFYAGLTHFYTGHTHFLHRRRNVPTFYTGLTHYMAVKTNKEAVNALLNYGALIVGIDSRFLKGLNGVSSTYSQTQCIAPPQIDHIVNIVGWTQCQVGIFYSLFVIEMSL